MNGAGTTETYFANLEGEALTTALTGKVRTYQEILVSSGYLAIGFKSVQTVQGMDRKGYTTFELRRTGGTGEAVKLKVDEYASLYHILESALSGMKTVFDPQPSGEDWRASEQARLAKGLLESELKAGMADVLRKSISRGLKMGFACTATDYDPTAGNPILDSPDGSPPVRSGDLSTRSYMPQDACFDVEVRSPDEVKWWILRRWVNAHDLVAGFPERAQEIMAARGYAAIEYEVEIQSLLHTGMRSKNYNLDRVPLYEFRHDATPACPEGRIAWFLSSGGEPLFADALPFVDENGERRTCVRRFALMDVEGSAFGFSPLWYLLAPQEALDIYQSIEVTAYKAHGVGAIAIPRGADINPKTVGTALAVIEHPPGMEPKPINFTTLPPDLAGAQGRMVERMERLLNISPVDRGTAPPNVKSGSMALFMKATSAQAMQGHLEKVAAHHEGAAEDFLFLYALFIRFPRKVEVQGELAVREVEVSGEDLGGTLRVKIDLGNPLMHTLGGRMGLADSLLAQGAVDANGYLEFVSGVGMDRILKESDSQRVLVEQENAMLRRGEAPLVSPMDNPVYHVRRHALELNSQQARRNPAIRNAVLQHCQEHIQNWMVATMQNPGMLEALGIPPMQAALGMMGPPPPDGGGGPEGGAGPATPPAPGGPADSNQMPKPPRMPPGSAAATGVNPMAPGPGGVQ